MGISSDVILFLYKHCLVSRNDRQIVNLFYRTVKERVDIRGRQSEFLFFLSRDRKDFMEQFQRIYDCCREDKCMLKAEIRNVWNFRNMIRSLTVLCMYARGKKILEKVADRQGGLSVMDWLWISMTYARYEMYQEAFKRFDFSRSKFFVVYGEWIPEVAALSYANELGVTTVVNVQGMYSLVEKRQYPDYPKIIFVWGENDRILLHQNRPNMKVYVCGNPQIRMFHIQEDAQLIGIALGAHENHYYNQKIIDIAEQYAKKYGMKIYLRLHPGDDIQKYRIDSGISSENKNLDDAKFIIVHKTTMCITYMRMEKMVCAFEAEETEKNMKIDRRFFFHYLDSLEHTISENKGYDFSAYASSFMKYIDEEAAKVYGDVFDKLSKEAGF